MPAALLSFPRPSRHALNYPAFRPVCDNPRHRTGASRQPHRRTAHLRPRMGGNHAQNPTGGERLVARPGGFAKLQGRTRNGDLQPQATDRRCQDPQGGSRPGIAGAIRRARPSRCRQRRAFGHRPEVGGKPRREAALVSRAVAGRAESGAGRGRLAARSGAASREAQRGGFQAAYAVNDDGSFALVGRPAADGWKFEERPELAADIRRLIAATTGDQDAAFVNLPLPKP